MDNVFMEQLISSELDEIKGGNADTCVCENGGAGAKVIIIQPGGDDTTRDSGTLFT